MCIRDRVGPEDDAGLRSVLGLARRERGDALFDPDELVDVCLLYTSDAAAERSSVDLGGRRIIQKKNNQTTRRVSHITKPHKRQQQHT